MGNKCWTLATNFRRLIMDSLDKLNLLKKRKSFKFHVEQWKILCSYIEGKLSSYIENSGQYLGRDVRSKRVQSAWKEIYRAMKEAETYLKHCSTDSWRMKCFVLDNTDEIVTWDRRKKIAVDVDAGLAFLHKSGFPHGNVKPSNILLDDGNACLADSCLAGLVVKNSSVARNSSGYMAPEQNRSRKISEESDEYSFGMVLLRLVTRKDPSSQIPDLPAWCLRIGREG